MPESGTTRIQWQQERLFLSSRTKSQDGSLSFVLRKSLQRPHFLERSVGMTATAISPELSIVNVVGAVTIDAARADFLHLFQ